MVSLASTSSDGLASERFDEDLHATPETNTNRKDEALLIWRDAFFVLDLRFHIVNGVAGLHVQRDFLARERLDEDLHASSEAKYHVECFFLLDVVVREGSLVRQLLPRKDKALLIWRDSFFVLDFRLHVVNGVAGLDVQCDGLANEGLHEDLHSTTETKHQVER